MNYEEFKEEVYQELLKLVSANASVEQKTVNKNNGCIFRSNGKLISLETVSPFPTVR